MSYKNIDRVVSEVIVSTQTLTNGVDIESDSIPADKIEAAAFQLVFTGLASETITVTPQGTMDGTNWYDMEGLPEYTFTHNNAGDTIGKIRAFLFWPGVLRIRLKLSIDTGSATVTVTASSQ